MNAPGRLPLHDGSDNLGSRLALAMRTETRDPRTTGRPSDADCWDAILRRDAARDDQFFFGVSTTGVFCRPSCPARRPRPENVRFYATAAEAEHDGLRPCRRCRPTSPETTAAKMRALAEHIRAQADSGDALTLAALAKRAGMSAGHLQRRFRAVVGVTPRELVEACRLEALKRSLRAGESVTDAIYAAGFGSSSRVYERVDSRLGMTPRQYRAGGEAVEITYAAMSSPVGRLLVGATDRGLCFVQFGDSERELLAALRREYPAARLTPMRDAGSPAFRGWVDALRRHLDAGQPLPSLPLAVRASAFRAKVWRYLQSIPAGETRSYGEVARGIGRRSAARAVASACAANPLAIVVPCHRVIRSDGDLGGYRWGVERKRALLDRERQRAAARPAGRARRRVESAAGGSGPMAGA